MGKAIARPAQAKAGFRVTLCMGRPGKRWCKSKSPHLAPGMLWVGAPHPKAPAPIHWMAAHAWPAHA